MDLKSILGAIAPTIATALGGPLAGVAVKALSSELLGTDDASENDIMNAVMGADPEAIARIKQIDKDFELRMRELDVDVERINMQDRNSARDMAKVTGFWPQVILSVLFVLGYLATLNAFMDGAIEVAEMHMSVFHTIIGVLTAGVTQVLNFWLGSSKGSQQKTKMLEGK